jgi:FkbM family methyltransferase
MVNTRLIYDIGCHNGQDSDFYLKKGFSVIAVEANPALCRDIKSRFAAEIQNGRFVLIEKAIAEQDGDVSFFVHKESIWSTIRSDVADRHASSDITEIRVPTTKLSGLIRQYGVPHYLKIDIEGADHLCLQELATLRAKPQFLSTEIEQGCWRDFETGLHLLKAARFRQFAIINQATVPQQHGPVPAREGCFVDHQFELGAAGLFGAELPRAWISEAAIRTQYVKLYGLNKLHGLARKAGINLARKGSWYDLHAS